MSEARAKLRKRRRCEKIVQSIKARQILVKAWSKIDHQLKEYHRRRRLDFIVICLKFKFALRFKAWGPTLDYRLKNKIRHSVAYSGMCRYDIAKKRSQYILYRFMDTSALIDEFKSQLASYATQVIAIQKKFRARRARLQRREDVIKDIIWERESAYLYKFLSKKRKGEVKSKKLTKLLPKILNIPEPIIKRILFVYMTRQKFYYTIRFL